MNSPEIKNSSKKKKKLQQRNYEMSSLEKILMSYELHFTNYLKY